MKNSIESLLSNCKKIRKKLLLKQVNVFAKEYDKLVVKAQLNDINLFIKELEIILKKGE